MNSSNCTSPASLRPWANATRPSSDVGMVCCSNVSSIRAQEVCAYNSLSGPNACCGDINKLILANSWDGCQADPVQMNCSSDAYKARASSSSSSSSSTKTASTTPSTKVLVVMALLFSSALTFAHT